MKIACLSQALLHVVHLTRTLGVGMVAPINRSNCGSITTVDGLSMIWTCEEMGGGQCRLWVVYAEIHGMKFPSYNTMELLGCGGVRLMMCKTLSVWVVLAM